MTLADLAARAASIAAAADLAGAEVVGAGWATVELDRAAGELAVLGPWSDGPRDSLLGARVRVPAAGSPGPGPTPVLLEPDTEGRLAASLARHGEGVAAAWVRLGRDPAGPDPAGAVRWSAVAAGPFGPERLRLGPVVGPHLLVVLPDR